MNTSLLLCLFGLIDIGTDTDKVILENINIDIDIKKENLENIDIDSDRKFFEIAILILEILQNIDIDKILNRLEFGMSNRATRKCHMNIKCQ